jgi:hypothetical protein
MTNQFTGLDVDAEDTSTSNLSRKLAKMKRRLDNNPNDKDLKKRIEELELIVNPPKNDHKKKKVNNKKDKNEPYINLDEEYLKHREYWKEYRRVQEINRVVEKERIIAEKLKKRKEYYHSKRLNNDKVTKLIDENSDDDLLMEYRNNKMNGIKFHILMVLYRMNYPSDIMMVIMENVKKDIYYIPIKLFIQPDIFGYIERKYKLKNIENTLKLIYHPDKTRGKTNQLFIFINKIFDSKRVLNL